MDRYRVIYGPLRKRKTKWRGTRAEAIEDAIAKGLAQRDEHSGQLYWDPLASIEEQKGP